MDTLGQLMAAGGALGLLLVFVFGLIFFLLLPIASIIDCGRSDLDTGAKTFIIIVLIITWGFVSVIYGLFFARARWLRRLTGISLLLGMLIFVGSAVALFSGGSILEDVQEERDVSELTELVDKFSPKIIASTSVKPFPALHFVTPGSPTSAVLLTMFTLDGPNLDEAVTVDQSVRDMGLDINHSRYYVTTMHDVGTVSRSSGQLVKLDLEEIFPDFGRPKGIAFDSINQRIVVMTSHVYNYFYAYSPSNDEWTQLGQRYRGDNLLGLAFASDRKKFFSIVPSPSGQQLSQIATFNLSGNFLGYVTLQSPIPVAKNDSYKRFQIHYSSEKLILIIPDLSGSKLRVFAVNPDSGEVTVSNTFSQ